MNMTRRDFTKYSSTALLALATGSSIALDGCNVFTDIENWIPVGEAAIQGIVNLLEGAGLVTPLISVTVTTILNAFADILADIKSYQAMVPPPVTILDKIKTIFNLIVSNFQSLLSQIASNPIVVIIISLAQIILSTIAAFVGRLPAGSGVLALSTTFSVSSQRVTYTPKYRSVKSFKKDYNAAAMRGGHPEIQLKLSFAEHF